MRARTRLLADVVEVGKGLEECGADAFLGLVVHVGVVQPLVPGPAGAMKLAADELTRGDRRLHSDFEGFLEVERSHVKSVARHRAS